MKIIQVSNEKEYVEHMIKSFIDELCVMFNKKDENIYIICYDNMVDPIKEFFNIVEINEVTEKYKSKLIRSKEFSESTFIGRFDFINKSIT